MIRKLTGKDGIVRSYGSALGDRLRVLRGEIAQREAGEDGNADKVANALAEELAACVGGAGEYEKVESGELDPTPEQADALAKCLAGHGVEGVTGESLLALDKPEDEEEDDEDEDPDAKDEQLRAKETELTQLRAKHAATEADLATARSERDAAMKTRRDAVVRGVRVRNGGDIESDTLELINSFSPAQLDAYEKSLGRDPRVDTLCVACRKANAEPLFRSSEDPTQGGGPVGGRAPRDPVGGSGRARGKHDISAAARSYRASEAGRGLSVKASVAHVEKLPDNEFWALAEAG